MTAALAMGLGVVQASPASAETKPVTTSALEQRRVDRVPTPTLAWQDCGDGFDCTSVDLPRDYDRPKGATTSVALTRLRAGDPRRKIGTLFLNPGGPGGSGTEFVRLAPLILSPEVRARFDVVGFDPRGIGSSENVRCFRSTAEQSEVYNTLPPVVFPVTRTEERAFLRGAKAVGRACSTTGRPLSVSMSTAEVARDLDVLRRAVGDRKLTYLGFSYGSYLGQVYANLFPDRGRALALDGVVDPIAWAGTKANRSRPQWDRIRSADGASKALREVLARCAEAGAARCPYAAQGDPAANFALIAERLEATPLVIPDETGQPLTFGYADLVYTVLLVLYQADGGEVIAGLLSDLLILTDPAASRTVSAAATRLSADRTAATVVDTLTHAPVKPRPGARSAEAYDNALEAQQVVSCSDSINPRSRTYPAAADAADRRAPYFGRLWVWIGSFCASDAWTAKDEDAYRGPFTKRTVSPLLFIGNTWDPATNYRSAVKAQALAPNSRLLSSDSWGHTAYGTSACVTDAIDAYLLSVRLPAEGLRCVGDAQPFAGGPVNTTVKTLQSAVAGGR